MRTALFWVIKQRVMVISYRNFGTTLRMGPISCPETPVGNCHYSLSYNAEERSYQLLCGGSLKSRKYAVSFLQ